AHESVAEAAVVGMPDDKWGQRPLAYVVLGPGAEVDEAGLIAFVKTRIASYKAPSAVEFVDALPTASPGKNRKNALRERAPGQYPRSATAWLAPMLAARATMDV